MRDHLFDHHDREPVDPFPGLEFEFFSDSDQDRHAEAFSTLGTPVRVVFQVSAGTLGRYGPNWRENSFCFLLCQVQHTSPLTQKTAGQSEHIQPVSLPFPCLASLLVGIGEFLVKLLRHNSGAVIESSRAARETFRWPMSHEEAALLPHYSE